jgi:hypothetical protein
VISLDHTDSLILSLLKKDEVFVKKKNKLELETLDEHADRLVEFIKSLTPEQKAQVREQMRREAERKEGEAL